MRIRIEALSVAALALALASCAKHKEEVASAPPPPAPVAQPMPRPPMNAATGLALPQPAVDGSFATPNRGLSSVATTWHLRAALNVAVLQCAHAGDPMETQYNAFLKTHKAALARAHDALKAEYRKAHGSNWQDRFDDEQTRLYNFYAQPPARAAFCRTAAPLIASAATTPVGGLDTFAAPALASLDKPFTDFYRAYAQYRSDLVAWQSQRAGAIQMAAIRSAPVDSTPRLTVDPDLMMADTRVTANGRVQLAKR